MAETQEEPRVIVITGASSGFGKGVARKLSGEGSTLVLAARRRELLEELAAELNDYGACAIPVETDVSKRDDMERLAHTAVAEAGRIDVWVNNAGVGAIGCFERIPLADHEQVIRTDLLGTLYGSYFAYRQFLEQRSGTLINVASELGHHTIPYYSSYAAAKHGVVGLGDSLRQEVEQSRLEHIHICTVLPSAHDTPFFDHVANYSGHEVQAPRPLHDPENVVETIARLVRNPRDREFVGADGFIKVLLKKLMPGVEERLAARHMHRTQMVKAPAAADSQGSLRAPITKGTEVRAGRRK
jgi:short-subunit dehydrogenase